VKKTLKILRHPRKGLKMPCPLGGVVGERRFSWKEGEWGKRHRDRTQMPTREKSPATGPLLASFKEGKEKGILEKVGSTRNPSNPERTEG